MTYKETIQWLLMATDCYCSGIFMMTNEELAACYERKKAIEGKRGEKNG